MADKALLTNLKEIEVAVLMKDRPDGVDLNNVRSRIEDVIRDELFTESVRVNFYPQGIDLINER